MLIASSSSSEKRRNSLLNLYNPASFFKPPHDVSFSYSHNFPIKVGVDAEQACNARHPFCWLSRRLRLNHRLQTKCLLSSSPKHKIKTWHFFKYHEVPPNGMPGKNYEYFHRAELRHRWWYYEDLRSRVRNLVYYEAYYANVYRMCAYMTSWIGWKVVHTRWRCIQACRFLLEKCLQLITWLSQQTEMLTFSSSIIAQMCQMCFAFGAQSLLPSTSWATIGLSSLPIIMFLALQAWRAAWRSSATSKRSYERGDFVWVNNPLLGRFIAVVIGNAGRDHYFVHTSADMVGSNDEIICVRALDMTLLDLEKRRLRSLRPLFDACDKELRKLGSRRRRLRWQRLKRKMKGGSVIRPSPTFGPEG
jgi:hypothetical protein